MQVLSYTIPETLVVALIGMGVVFAALAVLIFLMGGLTAVTGRKGKGKSAPAPAPVAAPIPRAEPSPAQGLVPAKGSLGEIALYDVDDRTAALIMAIVADKLQKPLNELRFRSIRESGAGKGAVDQ